MVTQTIETVKVLASLDAREGTIGVRCENLACQRPIYVPAECLDRSRRVKEGYEVESSEGIVVSAHRDLNCSQGCWSEYEEH